MKCDGYCETCGAYLDYNCEEWFSPEYQETEEIDGASDEN